jgi:hypothetical protein
MFHLSLAITAAEHALQRDFERTPRLELQAPIVRRARLPKRRPRGDLVRHLLDLGVLRPRGVR